MKHSWLVYSDCFRCVRCGILRRKARGPRGGLHYKYIKNGNIIQRGTLSQPNPPSCNDLEVRMCEVKGCEIRASYRTRRKRWIYRCLHHFDLMRKWSDVDECIN